MVPVSFPTFGESQALWVVAEISASHNGAIDRALATISATKQCGAYAENVTKNVIDALAESGLEVKAVVGGSNPHLPGLRQAAEVATVGITRVDLVVNA